ncbi:MAG: hypothetical protein AB8B52_08105 [Winogradskyella sp.]|uniref:hypothetical protein n=1 Tax=Winogradskyella sp. TaxID=1883156 RepID=UPI00385985E6
MKITSVILGLCCLLVINCAKENNKVDTTENIEKAEQSSRITAKAIERIDYKDYALSIEAEQAIVTWEKYQELARQLGYLKKADFSFFNGDKVLLKTFIDEFKTQLPEDLKTSPILSRNAIVETELLKLNENLTIDNIERSEKLESIKGLFEAVSNLNYQINKKLERDLYDKIQPE